MNHTFKDNRLGASFVITDERDVIEKNREDETFRIIWNRGPDLDVEIDALPIRLQTDHVLCVTPNQKIKINDTHTEIRSFIFNREFYCIHENDHEVSCEGLLFYGTSGMSIVRLNNNELEKFELLYRVFLDEMQTRDSIQEEMLRMLLKRLIIKCTRLAKEQHLNSRTPDSGIELIRKFNILVEQHFREKKSVGEYAEMLHKSSKTLSNLFSKASDQTPLQVIHSRIILEAKRLMVYTDKTIKEISYELGYEEIPYFSRLFKKETGKSPSEFRKSAKMVQSGKY